MRQIAPRPEGGESRALAPSTARRDLRPNLSRALAPWMMQPKTKSQASELSINVPSLAETKQNTMKNPRGASFGCAALLALAIAAASLCAAPGQALAQDRGEASEEDKIKQVEQLYLEGIALYKNSQYREAIAKFEKAHAIFPDPNLLYNMGRAYELLGELEPALAEFERCMASADLPPELKTKAQARIASIQSAQKEAELAKAEAERNQAKSLDKKDAQASAGEQEEKRRSNPAPEESGSVLKTTGWITAAGSVGLLGAGGVFYFLGASDHGDLEDAMNDGGVGTLTRVEAEALAKDGEDRKTLGVILMASGGALALTSALCFLLDEDEKKEPVGAFTLQPVFLPGGIGVGLGGGFP